MVFWQCYYHTIWTTKNREPLITPAIEAVIFEIIRIKSTELGCPILAINGVSDHIHVAVCIPPKIAVAEWIGQVKGVSSHEINTMFPNLSTHFRWQKHYGVLTFGVRTLEYVTEYILRQKEHHPNNIINYLEQTDSVD